MALKACRECKKKVSTEASTCPSCGVPNPTQKKITVAPWEADKKSKVTTKHAVEKKPSKNSSSFIKSFWDGEYSLVQSFWGYGVVGNIIAALPLVYAQENVNKMSDSTATFFLIYFAFFVAFFVWVNVGIWNSASNHTKVKQNIWGSVVKVVVILSVINAIGQSFFGL
tara:strand:- start:70 stop:573 length:504 start_codon:yes stop_codon:yes gene_type:complete